MLLPKDVVEIVKQYNLASYEKLLDYIVENPIAALCVSEWRAAVEANRLTAPRLQYEGERGVYHDGDFRIANDVVYKMITTGHTTHLSKFVQHADGSENYVLLTMRFNRKNALRDVLDALEPNRRLHERYLAYRYSRFMRNRRSRCVNVVAASCMS